MTTATLRQRVRRWDLEAPVNGMVFGRSGQVLALALGDGTLRLVPRAETEAALTVEAHDGAALSLDHDLGPGDAFLSGGDDGRLVRISADGERQVLLHQPGRWIDALAVAETVRAVAFGAEIRLLDAAGSEIARSADHPSTVAALAFNPKGKRLAVAHYGGVTLRWTASFGAAPKRLDWAGSHLALSWSPDGDYIMTATQENELHGWRLADGADMRMSGYDRKVRSLGWTAKPLFLVSAGSGAVIAWPFAGKGPMGRQPLQFGDKGASFVAVVAAHPKRPLVAFAYEDGELRLAELGGDRMIALKPAGDGRPTQLAWSPDGTALALGTLEGGTFLFELG
jgi:WD40 repeat protein